MFVLLRSGDGRRAALDRREALATLQKRKVHCVSTAERVSVLPFLTIRSNEFFVSVSLEEERSSEESAVQKSRNRRCDKVYRS